MARIRSTGNLIPNLIIILGIAAGSLALFAQLFQGGEFTIPTSAQPIVSFFQILIVTLVIALVYWISIKFGKGSFSPRDYWTVLVLSAVLIFLYVYILEPSLGFPSLRDLSFNTAKAMKFVP